MNCIICDKELSYDNKENICPDCRKKAIDVGVSVLLRGRIKEMTDEELMRRHDEAKWNIQRWYKTELKRRGYR